MSSSQESSSSESSIGTVTSGSFWDPKNFTRERLGYSQPIIEPGSIATPQTFSLEKGVLAANSLLAILFLLVMALSALVMRHVLSLDPARVQKLLLRMPLQALLTLLVWWLGTLLITTASAQDFMGSSVSLFKIPLFAILFFAIVGASNYLFDSILESDMGERTNDALIERTFLKHFRTGTRTKSTERTLILLLILAYGVAGAAVSTAFSLYPTQELGMALVAIVAVLVSGYAKSLLSYPIARKWKLGPFFKANLIGLFFAIVCVVLGRTLDLSPGYIYGLPVSLVLVASLRDRHEAALEFFGILWMLILAFILWFIAPRLESYEVLYDFLNLTFVILVEAAFLELLPLPMLGGGKVFEWNRALWMLECAVVTFLLFHTLLNPESTVTGLMDSPPSVSAVLLLGCYAIGVFLLWGYVVLRNKRQ